MCKRKTIRVIKDSLSGMKEIIQTEVEGVREALHTVDGDIVRAITAAVKQETTRELHQLQQNVIEQQRSHTTEWTAAL
eukprot:SAG31_NODE_43094_length_268_cov_1.207101_1_plen_77_part_01